MTLSIQDSKYSFSFILLMHSLRVPYFNVPWILYIIIKEVLISLVSSTLYESNCIGTFFNHMLKEMNKWQNITVYKQECLDTIGFDSNNVKTSKDPIDHKKYKEWYDWWIKDIDHGIKMVFEWDYIEARNGCDFIKQVLNSYPNKI